MEIYKSGVIVSDKVTYTDRANNIFAIKDVDYSDDVVMPDFSLENQETGHVESAIKQSDQLQIIFSSKQTEEKEQATIPLPEKAIIDAGFDQFIIKYWDQIIEGEKLVRQMLIPSMKRFIEFRIYQSEKDEVNGIRTLIVEPNSLLLRFVADPLVLQYDLDQPRLNLFEGVSNMRDAQGKNLLVKIKFDPNFEQAKAK
ncbi:MAG: hypothetical protein AAF410_06375 [Pseudomonadota bacterium]